MFVKSRLNLTLKQTQLRGPGLGHRPGQRPAGRRPAGEPLPEDERAAHQRQHRRRRPLPGRGPGGRELVGRLLCPDRRAGRRGLWPGLQRLGPGHQPLGLWRRFRVLGQRLSWAISTPTGPSTAPARPSTSRASCGPTTTPTTACPTDVTRARGAHQRPPGQGAVQGDAAAQRHGHAQRRAGAGRGGALGTYYIEVHEPGRDLYAGTSFPGGRVQEARVPGRGDDRPRRLPQRRDDQRHRRGDLLLWRRRWPTPTSTGAC